MKDNYIVHVGYRPEELFEKIEGYTDVEQLARSLSVYNPSLEWKEAKESLIESLLMLVIETVEPAERNMDTFKDFLEKERVHRPDGITELCAEIYARKQVLESHGLVPGFVKPYEKYRRMPEDIRLTIVTEVFYLFGLGDPLYIGFSAPK